MFRSARPTLFGVLITFALVGCGPTAGASPLGANPAGPAGPTAGASPLGASPAGPASPTATPASPSPASSVASAAASHGPALPGRIAFGRFDSALGDFQVFTMLADGSDVRLLLPGAHEGPAWSPDNSAISVTSFEGGNFLRVLRPDGTLVRELKAPDATLGLGCDNWSPDGTRLVCEGWDDAHPDRIGAYTVRASDGGDLVRLTSPADQQHDIPGGYSPDGTRIAFVHVTDDAREQGQLWIMDTDGGNAQRANEATIGYGVHWSPDGRSIVGDGGGSLLIFDAGHLSNAPRRITIPNAGAFGASWSPDGSRLAFSVVSAAGNSPDIATIATDGTDLQILTTDPAKEEIPAWGLPTP
jgi:Tol biopolymer transport system component